MHRAAAHAHETVPKPTNTNHSTLAPPTAWLTTFLRFQRMRILLLVLLCWSSTHCKPNSAGTLVADKIPTRWLSCAGHGAAPSSGSRFLQSTCPSTKTVTFYDSAMSAYFPPEAIDTDLVTHVHYSFGAIEPDTLNIIPYTGSTDISLVQRFISVVTQNPCAKPILTIGSYIIPKGVPAGGVGTPWRQAGASTESKALFTANVIAFCRQYGFLGVDLVRVHPGLTVSTPLAVRLRLHRRRSCFAELGVSCRC